jgi:hypothetical protein
VTTNTGAPWVPLSQRGPGQPAVRPLVEGVTDWLYPQLQLWLYRALQGTSTAVMTVRAGGFSTETRETMLRLEVTTQPWLLPADDPKFLDAIDAALHVVDWSWPRPPDPAWEDEASLERMLAAANSVWRVSDRFRGLEHRVDPTVTQAVQVAADVDPTAGDHLAAAWEAAYGLHPDPDKAYSEAVRAVETLINPLVSPKSSRPTLGKSVADLKSQRGKWELAIGDQTGQPASIDGLLAMLDLLLTSQTPSRHGGGPGSRRHTQTEGESAVHLAATLVQWLGNGVLRRR